MHSKITNHTDARGGKSEATAEAQHLAERLLFSWSGGGVRAGLRWTRDTEIVTLGPNKIVIDAWTECDDIDIANLSESDVEAALLESSVSANPRVIAIRRLRIRGASFRLELRENFPLGLNKGDDLSDYYDDGDCESLFELTGSKRGAVLMLGRLNPGALGNGKLSMCGSPRKGAQQSFKILGSDCDPRSLLALLARASDVGNGGDSDFNTQFILSDKPYVAAARLALSEFGDGVESYAFMPIGCGAFSLEMKCKRDRVGGLLDRYNEVLDAMGAV